MKRTNLKVAAAALATLSLIIFSPQIAQAHCDGLDGPVVNAARQALAEKNVNVVLVWVQKSDEPEIKRVFEKTLAVRKLGAEAKDVADQLFFETLVRVHRAGEGAPFTGLKPAGRDLGPAIPTGDKAVENGEIEPVLQLLSAELKRGLHERFNDLMTKKKLSKNDVEAGRAFVNAYVAYIHYVEGLHEAAKRTTHEHPEEISKAPDHHPAGHHEE